MAEFYLDPTSIASAETLSARLMSDVHSVVEAGPRRELWQEVFSDARHSELAEGIPIGDVITNVSYMAAEFAMSHRYTDSVLCLVLADDEMVPISISGGFGFSESYPVDLLNLMELWARHGSPLDYLLRELYHRGLTHDEALRETGLREAESRVERSLSQFLAYRIAGVKHGASGNKEPKSAPTAGMERTQATRLTRLLDWIRGTSSGGTGGGVPPPEEHGPGIGGPPPTPDRSGGLHVVVSCQTPGLRIHVSPAYFINWAYFGCPTTPVESYVLPGRYVFSGDGPILPRRRTDPCVFCIPPTYQPQITRF